MTAAERKDRSGLDRSTAASDGAATRRVLAVLADRRRLVLVTATLTAITTMAVLAAREPVYAGRAVLLVTPVADAPPLSGLGLIPDSADPTRDVETAAQLVTQPAVADAVADVLRSPAASEDLRARVNAVPIAQSHLVAITVRDPLPRRAAALATAFAEQTVALRNRQLNEELDRLLPSLERRRAQAADPNARSTLTQWIVSLQALHETGDPTIRLQSPASIPATPDGQGPVFAVAVSLLAGLLLGVAAAFVAELLDGRIRHEDQARDRSGMPVLARIPRERPTGSALPPERLSPASLEAYALLAAMLDVVVGPVQPERNGATERAPTVHWDSNGLHTTGLRGGHVVVVTGSTPGEGKTTTAINLSAALADLGAHVIMIDADVPRPAVGAALGVAPQRTLHDVLTARSPLAQALVPAPGFDARLRLLLPGQAFGSGTARLSPAALDRLLAESRKLADVVVVDAPPTTTASDAWRLTERADEVIVVARLGTTTSAGLERLADMFERSDITPLGLVIVGTGRPRDPGSRRARDSEPATETMPVPAGT